MISHPRGNQKLRAPRGWLWAALCLSSAASATPFTPLSDTQLLAEIPAGSAHVATSALQLSRSRPDIALPLTQFYVQRARVTGDLRLLGYAETTLTPLLSQSRPLPAALILHATILQSRHAFEAALAELDRALTMQPENAQAWLTRATVLRVLGRYDEALASCDQLAKTADTATATLCVEGVRSLTGHLQTAYDKLTALPSQSLPDAARAWRYSELGEMAERLGRDREAEHWFVEGLKLDSGDLYMRGAYCDLLLRQARNTEALELVRQRESLEPMLLRRAIAEARLRADQVDKVRSILGNTFILEEERGDAVHRREQARFLLDVESQPARALAVSQENWRTQREPDDVLILLRAARAAHQPRAAEPALEFIRRHKLEDVRIDAYRGSES
jgi:tetratricopeptide (TPR) repeat protein